MQTEKKGAEFDRSDLIREVAARENVYPETAQKHIEAFAGIVPEALGTHGRVEIHGLGTFSLRLRKERTGVFKGQPYTAPAHYVVHFKPAPAFAKTATASSNSGLQVK